MSHPYYPIDVQLPGYQGLVVPLEQILAILFSACAVVLFAGWFITGLTSVSEPLGRLEATKFRTA
jgi:hypothetical protein